MPDQGAQRAAAKCPFIVPECPASLGRSPQILANEIEHPPILDVDRQLVEQYQVVDGGVIGLHVGPKHEAVGREMVAHALGRNFNRPHPARGEDSDCMSFRHSFAARDAELFDVSIARTLRASSCALRA
jgi:hypothetical protein